jgi:hypothetical protein
VIYAGSRGREAALKEAVFPHFPFQNGANQAACNLLERLATASSKSLHAGKIIRLNSPKSFRFVLLEEQYLRDNSLSLILQLKV